MVENLTLLAPILEYTRKTKKTTHNFETRLQTGCSSFGSGSRAPTLGSNNEDRPARLQDDRFRGVNLMHNFFGRRSAAGKLEGSREEQGLKDHIWIGKALQNRGVQKGYL